MAKMPPIKVPVEVDVKVNTIIGNLQGAKPVRDACDHQCGECGKRGSEMLFGMIRDAEVDAHWYLQNHRTITRKFMVQQIAGGPPYGITLNPLAEPPVIPPPPPEVWLVYKFGGRYGGDDKLQGIYDSRDGAMDSVRFAVRDERNSLLSRLGQPVPERQEEEPPLEWRMARHWRYGLIPGEYWTSAGIADFVVRSHKVLEGYLPDVTHTKIQHVIRNPEDSWRAPRLVKLDGKDGAQENVTANENTED